MQGVGIVLGIAQFLVEGWISGILRGMATPPEIRLNDTAKRVCPALSKHLSTAGSNKLPKSVPDLYAKIPEYNEDRFYRLYHWLKEFTEKKDPLAYAALLQIWLNTCGLRWPKNVFAAVDLESPGRGRRSKYTVAEKVNALRSAGRTWYSIAKELQNEFRKEKPLKDYELRTLADRLRKMPKSTPPSLGGLDEPVLAVGLKMLGRLTPQEYDEFLRDAFRDDPEAYEMLTKFRESRAQ